MHKHTNSNAKDLKTANKRSCLKLKENCYSHDIEMLSIVEYDCFGNNSIQWEVAKKNERIYRVIWLFKNNFS